jgi:hypothetical protein
MRFVLRTNNFAWGQGCGPQNPGGSDRSERRRFGDGHLSGHSGCPAEGQGRVELTARWKRRVAYAGRGHRPPGLALFRLIRPALAAKETTQGRITNCVATVPSRCRVARSLLSARVSCLSTAERHMPANSSAEAALEARSRAFLSRGGSGSKAEFRRRTSTSICMPLDDMNIEHESVFEYTARCYEDNHWN